MLVAVLLLAGCSSGGDDAQAPVTSPAPILSFAAISVNEGNSGTTDLTFAVSLSDSAKVSVNVDYVTAGGTLTIPAGQTSGTITVAVAGDTNFEPDETLTMTLSNASAGATLGTASATGTITNDDNPTLSIADVSVIEGNSGTKNLTFTVSLSDQASGSVNVDYATADGTATAGSDYTAASGTLTIPAGQTSGTITVVIAGDTNVEPDETLTLTLSNASANATLGTATATGTITNDDNPTLSIADASVIEGNSGTKNLTFTVALSDLANGSVNVDYATADGSATAGSDYTAASGSLIISSGQTSATITVVVASDTNYEPDETLTLTLSNVSANATLGTPSATGTITTDDHGLNDTGITADQCYQAGSNTLVACSSAGALALNNAQDGMTGRDAVAATNSSTDGKLGFSFSAVAGGCVLDNVTGLLWEVKTADGGLRDWGKTYTNYGDNRAGDASAYSAAVNATNLCGYSDWRLPTADELQTIVDYGVASPGPTIDATWFPNKVGNAFWSASPVVGYNSLAWGVYFYYGNVLSLNRRSGYDVRLVRAGQ